MGTGLTDVLVGRSRELAALAKLIDQPDGSKRSALVEGEVGIGKTRLVAELLDLARKKGVQVLQGCCYPVREAGPYFPFFQILSEDGLGAPQSHELLRGIAGGAINVDGNRWLSEDVGTKRAQFLRELSDFILRKADRAETLICLEDLQWADPGSLLLLNNLLDIRNRHLSIICTARTDEHVEPEVQQLLYRIREKSRRIILRGLSCSDVKDIIGSAAGLGEIAEDEIRYLHSFTAGNPMFLREWFLHLRETGLLEEHTLAEATKRSSTPRSLTHVVDLRLRSFPPSVFETLSAASVIGMEFSSDLVAKAEARPEPAILDHLERCTERGILHPAGAIADSRFRFAHPLVVTRLYELLAPTRRRRLHRRIADAATFGHVSLKIEELARHHALGFGAAGRRRAIDHCKRAAEDAESVVAYETAAHFWELALRSTGPRSRRQRAELYRRLGRALWAAKKWTQAADAWREAARLFESLKDSRQLAELALALGEMHRFRQDLDESERWLKLALELLPRGWDRAKALALLGTIHCVRDDPDAGRRLLEESANAMPSHGCDPIVKYWLSFGSLTSGDLTGAYSLAKEGLDEALALGASNATSLLAGSLVQHELGYLRVTSARSYARLVDQAAEPTDTAALTRALLCRALLLGYEGKWNRVVKLCERWMSEVRLAGKYHLATARVIWAEARLALGDASAAQEEMKRALPDLEQMRPLAGLQRARALLQLGDQHEAARIIHAVPEQLVDSPRFAAGRAMLGEVASALDMPDLWQRCYDVLGLETRPIVLVYTPVSVQRVLGRLSSRLKAWPKAIEHFETATQQLAAGKAHWELVQTYLDYAGMRRIRGRRGDRSRAQALEMQAERLLSGLGIQGVAVEPSSQVAVGANRFGLTGREIEILTLVARGLRNPEIAESLTLSRRTIESHLVNSYSKMGARNRAEAVLLAVQDRIIGPMVGQSIG